MGIDRRKFCTACGCYFAPFSPSEVPTFRAVAHRRYVRRSGLCPACIRNLRAISSGRGGWLVAAEGEVVS